MSKECLHQGALLVSYGFGAASGWQGIGVNYRCQLCYKTLWFEDDTELMDQAEKEHNNKMRETRQQWHPDLVGMTYDDAEKPPPPKERRTMKAKYMWTCSTAFLHEIGETGVTFFPTLSALKAEWNCVACGECLPVRVRITKVAPKKRRAK
jgi:hypothetical protein